MINFLSRLNFSLQLLLQQQKANIPEAHIMKRWTRQARDVVPEHLKSYQVDQSAVQSATFRHRLLQLQSVKLVAKGDQDVELFEIAMKHMKAAEKESDELIAARLKNAEFVQEEDSSDDEANVNKNSAKKDCRKNVDRDSVGVQSDGEVLRRKKGPAVSVTVVGSDGEVMQRNRYGASGSSAVYSDSEILQMKAPVFKKKTGRPRGKRFIS